MKNQHDVKSCETCVAWSEQLITLAKIIRAGGIPVRTHIGFLEELCRGPMADHVATTVLNLGLAQLRQKLQRLKAKETRSHAKAIAV